MKKLIPLILVCMMITTIIFAAGKKEEEQKYTLTVATVTADSHIQGRALKEYGNRLSEKTRGGIEFRIFYNGQLGKSETLRDAVIKGNVDIMNEGLGLYSSFHPVFDLLEAFYSFKSLDHFKRVINTPGSLEYFENLTLKNPGVRILFYTGGYERDIISSFPVNDIADLRGKTMRSRNVQVEMEWWKLLGAIPVPVDFGEIYTAMQTGVVLGTQNSTEAMISSRLVEVGKYVARTQHRIEMTGVVMNNARFEGLPKEYQEAMIRVARDVQKEYIEIAESETEDHMKTMREKFGVTITKPNLAPFSEASRKQFWDLSDKLNVREIAEKIFN
jgi:TRAP-type C4-dicarboxylate transport system substrate-binding protein